ncbi:MAG: 1,4-alpha-glucan branching protein domain-containing protein [Gemmatimonadaceae bacterium]
MDFVLTLHSHLPYVLNHGTWPHGTDWLSEAAIDSYLPLLAHLLELETAAVPAPLTIAFTPVLANQLASPTFCRELDRYFEARIASCTETALALSNVDGGALSAAARFWGARLDQLRTLFHAIDRDIPTAFRNLASRGRIELAGGAATHGFLPLLGRDESIRLQLGLGRSEHTRIFGSAPDGCWVPECAYRPRGWWEPLPGAPHPRVRAGVGEYVAEAGFRWFFADAQMAREDGETRTPYRAYDVIPGADGPRPVSVLVRDPRSSAQVWSRHGGYPGDQWYLEFHKIRYPGGLRLWRVSAPGADLGDKQPYVPHNAVGQVREHARHYAEVLANIAREQYPWGTNLIATPFDTELYGHWWFEGTQFLADLFRALLHHGSVRPVTASQHLAERPERPGLRLAQGSWGADGDFSMWLNQRTAWTWLRLWPLEDAFWDLAPHALAEPSAHVALAQAARELLLAQSSDWQFIISTGEATDYAEHRFHSHSADLTRLLDALRDGLATRSFDNATRIATELRTRDDIFPDVLPSIATALGMRPGLS